MTCPAETAAARGCETWCDGRDAVEQSRGSVSVEPAPAMRVEQASAAMATLPLALPCPACAALIPAALSPATLEAAVSVWPASSPVSALNLDKLTQEMTACAGKQCSMRGDGSDYTIGNWTRYTLDSARLILQMAKKGACGVCCANHWSWASWLYPRCYLFPAWHACCEKGKQTSMSLPQSRSSSCRRGMPHSGRSSGMMPSAARPMKSLHTSRMSPGNSCAGGRSEWVRNPDPVRI